RVGKAPAFAANGTGKKPPASMPWNPAGITSRIYRSLIINLACIHAYFRGDLARRSSLFIVWQHSGSGQDQDWMMDMKHFLPTFFTCLLLPVLPGTSQAQYGYDPVPEIQLFSVKVLNSTSVLQASVQTGERAGDKSPSKPQ